MELRPFWWWPVVLVFVQLSLNGCFGCWEQERIALLKLKASAAYVSAEYFLSSWDSSNKDSDCCEWKRVKCNITTGRVIQLNLNWTIFSNWYFDASLFLPFEDLQYLDLSWNNILGWIPNEGFERFSALGKLEALNLEYNKFNISVLSSLSGIASLKELDLGYNNMNKSIHMKELSKLNNLEQLKLDGSSIDKSFLHKIGVMTSLNVLSVGDCGLYGTLPNQGWCELKKLQETDFCYNYFEGRLPSCMANLTSLCVLDISNNNFLIPSTFSFLFNLSNLKILRGDNNILTLEPDSPTSIPTFQLKVFTLANCPFSILNRKPPRFLHYQYDLRAIDLSHNKLVGQFPKWLLENNTRLEAFSIKNNSFTGLFTVPYDVRPNMWSIDISDNYLHGPIPTNLGLIFPNLYILNISKNEFQGNIPPSFGNLVFLWSLDLSGNNFSGTIPMHFIMGCNYLESLILSNNSFSGQIFLTNSNWTYRRFLRLDNNHFSGTLPTWMGNMTELEYIVMAKNHFEGPIPIDLCKLVDLQFLDLSDNNLFGSVPSCFNSSRISFFQLNKNCLSGPIPSSFQNNSNLLALNLRDNYLTGNIPNWIGSLSSVRILLLKGNHLGGQIPTQVCHLQNLNILDLSHNKFSGQIPHCLSNITFDPSAHEHSSVGGLSSSMIRPFFWYTKPIIANLPPDISFVEAPVNVEEVVIEFTTKAMTYSYKGHILNYMFGIDLSCNNLTGKIPPELGRISSNIRALNLSHNNLSGPIPVTFSNLKQIESLDLSYNNLNGKIPPQLIEMTSLAVFCVAHNNLSGATPDRKNQFITFDEYSYEGNPLLCGPPLQNGVRNMK